MNKRIIIVGPAAAGKDHLKKKFKERGFELDVSYTTREPREGEVDGRFGINRKRRERGDSRCG